MSGKKTTHVYSTEWKCLLGVYSAYYLELPEDARKRYDEKLDKLGTKVDDSYATMPRQLTIIKFLNLLVIFWAALTYMSTFFWAAFSLCNVCTCIYMNSRNIYSTNDVTTEPAGIAGTYTCTCTCICVFHGTVDCISLFLPPLSFHSPFHPSLPLFFSFTFTFHLFPS